jgi:ketosteroid isomerase-like protein
VSDENERLARDSLEALFRRDVDAWIEGFDRNVVYVPTREWFDAAPRRGRDELQEFMRVIWEDWAVWDMKIKEVRGNGDRVLVETRVRGIGERSGIELRGRTFHVFTIREGRILELRDFIDRDAAMAAAGLST